MAEKSDWQPPSGWQPPQLIVDNETTETPDAVDSSQVNHDIADTGLADVGLPSPSPPVLGGVPMGRPQFQRNQPQPPPPHQPPPPPGPQQIGNPNDSLSLMQLRRIVNEFPKTEPLSYAFHYSDTATYEEEVDEWFSYNPAEFKRLNRAREAFERRWAKHSPAATWLEAEDSGIREVFLQDEIQGMLSEDLRKRCKSLQIILHIILGVWHETAGLKAEVPQTKIKDPETECVDEESSDSEEELSNKTKATKPQTTHMKAGIKAFSDAGGISILFNVMQNAFKHLWLANSWLRVDFADNSRDEDFRETQLTEEDIPLIQDELDNVTTIMYLVIEGTRHDLKTLASTRAKLGRL